MTDVIESMLDLMRRLPPTRTKENVGALVDICPDESDELLQSVDVPLEIMVDHATGREYLACDYNRDRESYRWWLWLSYPAGSSHNQRSPWSNEYDPPLDDGAVPSSKMRKLEIQANEAFDTYREMYYEGGVSSVYLWDPEDPNGASNFAGVVVMKKGENFWQVRNTALLILPYPSQVMNPNTPFEPSGSWDSIHVFEAAERGRQAHYKLTSTIMLQLITRKGSDNDTKSISERRGTEGWKRDGEVSLSGSMTRQVRLLHSA